MSDFDKEVIEKVINSILDSDKTRDDKVKRIMLAFRFLYEDG